MNANEVTQRFVQSYYNLYASRIVQTKKQFCDACGTYSYNLNMMAKGQRTCTLDMLCRCIAKYNISPVWLFTGDGSFFRE